MSKEIKIGCIGCGMMGGALIKAIAKKVGGEKILLSDGDVEKAKSLALELGANFVTSNKSEVIRDIRVPIFVLS